MMIKGVVTQPFEETDKPVQQPNAQREHVWQQPDGIDASLETSKKSTATKTMALKNNVEFGLMFQLVDLKAPLYQNMQRLPIRDQKVDWSSYYLTRESRASTDSVTVISPRGEIEMNLDDFVEHFIELLLLRDFKMKFTIKLDNLVTAIKDIIRALTPNKASERVYEKGTKCEKVSYKFKLTESQSGNSKQQKMKLLECRNKLKLLIRHKNDVQKTVEKMEIFTPMLEGFKSDMDKQRQIQRCCTEVEAVQALCMAQTYRYITFFPLEDFLQKQNLGSNNFECFFTTYRLEVDLLIAAVSPQRTDNLYDAKTDSPINQDLSHVNFLSSISKPSPINPNLEEQKFERRQQTPDVRNSKGKGPVLSGVTSAHISKVTPIKTNIQFQKDGFRQQTPDYRNSQDNTPLINGSSNSIGLESAMLLFHNEKSTENFGAQNPFLNASPNLTYRVPDFETLWISQSSSQWNLNLPDLINFFNGVLPGMEFEKLIKRKNVHGTVILVSTLVSSESHLSASGSQIVGACVVRKSKLNGCLEILLFGIAENRRASKGMRESKYLMHAVKHIAALQNFRSLSACVHKSAVKFFCGSDFHKLEATSSNVATIVKDMNPAQFNYSGSQEFIMTQDVMDEVPEPNVFAMFCCRLVKLSEGQWQSIDELQQSFMKFCFNSIDLNSKKLCAVCEGIQKAKYTQSETASPPYLPPQELSSKKTNKKLVANGERLEAIRLAIKFLGGNTGWSKKDIAEHIKNQHNRNMSLNYIKKWFNPLIEAGILTCQEGQIRFLDDDYQKWLKGQLQKNESGKKDQECKQETEQPLFKEEQMIIKWPEQKLEVAKDLMYVMQWFSEQDVTLDLLGTKLQKVLDKHVQLQGPQTLISKDDVVQVFFERASQCSKYDRAPAFLKETMIGSLFSFFLQYLQPLKNWLAQPDCIVCDLKFQTKNIQHKQHCFSSKINYIGFSDFGPIFPSDADATYGQVKEFVAMTKVMTQQSDFDTYQQIIKKKKASTLPKRERKLQEKLKEDLKLQGENEASAFQQKMSGSYLAAKMCYDWVLFFGTDLIAEQLNATQQDKMGKELFLCIWLMGKENWMKLQKSLALLHPNYRIVEDVAVMQWTQNFAFNQIVKALVQTNGCYDLKENGQRPNPNVLNRQMCIKNFVHKQVLIRTDYMESFLKHFIPVYEMQKALKEKKEKSKNVLERKYALRNFNRFQRMMKFLTEQCRLQGIETKNDDHNLIK